MTDHKIERGEAVWSGAMIGVWTAFAALGVWRAVEAIVADEVPWVGLLVLALSSGWVARHVVMIIDYSKQ